MDLDEAQTKDGSAGRGVHPELEGVSDAWLGVELQQWETAVQGWAETIPVHQAGIDSLTQRIAEVQANIDDTIPRLEAARDEMAARAKWDKANG